MAKNNKPIINVNKTNTVFAKTIAIDFSKSDSKKFTTTLPGNIVRKDSMQIRDDTRGLMVVTPYVSNDVMRGFYEQNPYHFRSVKILSRCVTGLGFDILPDDTANEKYQNDSEYKLLKGFTDNPTQKIDEFGERQSFEEIINCWSEDKYNFGVGYLEIARTLKSVLAEIFHMRAYNTYVRKTNNRISFVQKKGIKLSEFRPFGAKYMTDRNEVLRIMNYNPFNDYYPYPPGYSATGDMTLDRLAVEANIKRFKNNLMIQFMIICEGAELDDTAMKQVQDFLISNYKGVENAGKVMYLSTDDPNIKIRIENLDTAVRDVSFAKLFEICRDRTIVVHGLFGRLMNVVAAGSLGGGGEADAQFRMLNETIIMPEKKQFANKLNFLFREALGITKFHLEFKELNLELFKSLVEAFAAAKNADILNRNESRIGLGYEPEEETNLVNELSIVKSKLTEISKRI